MVDYTKTTINLPTRLLKDAKLFAIEHSLTFTDLVSRGLEYSVYEKTQKNAKPSFAEFMKTFKPFPRLSEKESQERYHKHMMEKYGKDLS
ncbi:MAG TPA: hypothetical protein VD999_01920 [Vitreimonas sp.]|nr:hypothetical protein [Vitreimonas sp.]